jgi:hypothetical protein
LEVVKQIKTSSLSAVLSIPEGVIFYDINEIIYIRKVSKEGSSTGYVRIDRAGKEIKAEAPAKKTWIL